MIPLRKKNIGVEMGGFKMEGWGRGRIRVSSELDAFCKFSSNEEISAELCSDEDECQRESFD